MHRTTRALALGLALALVIPGAAFAATASSTTTASVTVNSVISMSGIPATYNIGAQVPGQRTTGPEFTITVASSDPFSVAVTATVFTKGADTMPVVNELDFITNGTTKSYTGPDMAIGSTTPMTEKLSFPVPLAAKSGTYTSTITWTASN